MTRPDASATAQVRAYHERTKHRLERYANGPDFLDWEQQPDPFRRFAGAPLIPLPLELTDLPDPCLGDLDEQPPAAPLNGWSLRELSCLLRYSLGLAAWKQFGPDRWSLRCNPSSGNLHPTEGYLIARGLKCLRDGLYHYAPHEHALEWRCAFPPPTDPSGAELMVGLSSIAWREAWKYGERAYRYVQLDLGHAIGALAYAAATLGCDLSRLAADEASLVTLMGLDRDADFEGAERERPDLLLRLSPRAEKRPGGTRLDDWLSALEGAHWHGRANTLSAHPGHHWPIIDHVAEAAPSDAHQDDPPTAPLDYPPPLSAAALSARRLILQRRSAQAFSGKASLPRESFYALLDSLLPRFDRVPWRSWPREPMVHPVLFVHRVDGLAPGLYLLARTPAALNELRQALDPNFEWTTPEGCPAHLPLHRLLAADTRRAARAVSCHQEIAASSFFSLGMLAEFERALQQRGSRAYPELFWEAGLIGQVLYLQAEAVGERGTGIGCFFDDSLHEILGLGDSRFQSLYHFTVGRPKTDERLQTLPPYDHLQRS